MATTIGDCIVFYQDQILTARSRENLQLPHLTQKYRTFFHDLETTATIKDIVERVLMETCVLQLRQTLPSKKREEDGLNYRFANLQALNRDSDLLIESRIMVQNTKKISFLPEVSKGLSSFQIQAIILVVEYACDANDDLKELGLI